jgi:hypothetical protein
MTLLRPVVLGLVGTAACSGTQLSPVNTLIPMFITLSTHERVVMFCTCDGIKYVFPQGHQRCQSMCANLVRWYCVVGSWSNEIVGLQPPGEGSDNKSGVVSLLFLPY